jgi:hypothetical protein
MRHIPNKVAISGPMLLLAELIVMGESNGSHHADSSHFTETACAALKRHDEILLKSNHVRSCSLYQNRLLATRLLASPAPSNNSTKSTS